MPPPNSPPRPTTPPPLQEPPQPAPPPPIQDPPPLLPPPPIVTPQPSPSTQDTSPPSSSDKPQVSSPSTPQQPPSTPNDIVNSPREVSFGYSQPQNSTPSNHLTRATTRGQWSTGVCECHLDWCNCCITCLCPCIIFGQISQIVDKGSSSCIINGAIYTFLAIVLGSGCVYSALYRRRLRYQFNLDGTYCGDCCLHSFCEVCVLCQEYRELQLRGYDLSKGYDADVDRQIQEAMTMPPPHSSMRR